MSSSQSLIYQQAEDREKELKNKFWKGKGGEDVES
jgi:hypothetical protein